MPSVKDAHFDFSLPTLERYVSEANLDAIAITNHDAFDLDQFREIQAKLEVLVFPGIEVSLDCGHVLVISEAHEVVDFHSKAQQVSQAVLASRARPKDEEAAKDEQIERLKKKVGELVLDIDILKEANKGRPFGPGTCDE